MYEFYVLMARTIISHSFAALTHEIHVLFLPLEHKINIFLPLCNILYVYLDSNLGPKDI